MSGTIQFENFPADTWRPHGVFAEIRPNNANSGQNTQRGLLMAQKLAAGIGAANVPFLAFSEDQVIENTGAASMAHLMYRAWRRQDPYGELWVLPVADDAAGVAASGTATVAVSSPQAGTIPLYIAGTPVPVGVTTGQTAAQIATAMAAAINATANLPVTAAVNGSTAEQVDITARHKGLVQNDVDLRIAYYGVQNGERLPTGVTVTLVQMASGVTNPTLTTALSNLPPAPYDYIGFPWTDATSLTAIKGLLSEVTGRWSPINMLYGLGFTAYRGNLGAASSFGNGQNSQFISCLAFYDSPTPAWIAAADWAAVHARSLTINPALPMQEVALNLLAPPEQNRWDIGERNTLLYDGISTYYIQDDGTARIDRSITMYQVNAAGSPDDSWLDIETLAVLMFVARYIRSRLSSDFSRRILVENGTRIAGGSLMVTPNTIRAAALGYYAYLANRGVVTGIAAFEAGVAAQRVTRGQVRLFLPITVADQLRQIAVLIGFTK